MEITLLKGKVVNQGTHLAGETLEVSDVDGRRLILTKAAVEGRVKVPTEKEKAKKASE